MVNFIHKVFVACIIVLLFLSYIYFSHFQPTDGSCTQIKVNPILATPPPNYFSTQPPTQQPTQPPTQPPKPVDIHDNILHTTPRIVIATYYADMAPSNVKDLVWSNHASFASHNGYSFFDALDIPELRQKREYMHTHNENEYFFKFHIAKYFLDRKYDYFIWLDSDAVFMNFSRKFEEYIHPNFDVFVTIAHMNDDKIKLAMNGGAFIVKNSEWGKNFIELAINYTHTDCTEILQGRDPVPAFQDPVCYPNSKDTNHKGWGSDQGIIQYFLNYTEPEFRCHIMQTPFRTYNAYYPFWRVGDMRLHFPGYGHQRGEWIKRFLEEIDFYNGGVPKNPNARDVFPGYDSDKYIQSEDAYHELLNIPCLKIRGIIPK